VNLPAGIANLPEATTAFCHQITTLDRSKLTQKIGRLTDPFLRLVEVGIRAAIDLPE
jgi:mRNA-degrading endonuclease toxin of MazEF toxin-antitoxin module